MKETNISPEVLKAIAIKAAALDIRPGSPMCCNVTVKTDGQIHFGDVRPVEKLEPATNVDWPAVMAAIEHDLNTERKGRDYSAEDSIKPAAFIGIMLGMIAVVGGAIALVTKAIVGKKR